MRQKLPSPYPILSPTTSEREPTNQPIYEPSGLSSLCPILSYLSTNATSGTPAGLVGSQARQAVADTYTTRISLG